MTLFAHAGHWSSQLLYLAPLLVLVGRSLVGKLRERRERRGREKSLTRRRAGYSAVR